MVEQFRSGGEDFLVISGGEEWEVVDEGVEEWEVVAGEGIAGQGT